MVKGTFYESVVVAIVTATGGQECSLLANLSKIAARKV